jgi:hypothetical protein
VELCWVIEKVGEDFWICSNYNQYQFVVSMINEGFNCNRQATIVLNAEQLIFPHLTPFYVLSFLATCLIRDD